MSKNLHMSVGHFFMDLDPVVYWSHDAHNGWGRKNQECHERAYKGAVYRRVEGSDGWDVAYSDSHGWNYCPTYLVPPTIRLFYTLTQ